MTGFNQSLMLYALAAGMAITLAFLYDRLVCGDYAIPGTRLREHMFLLESLVATLSATPLILLGALRYRVGVDQGAYAKEFYAHAAGKPVHTDRGFQLLNGLIYHLGGSDQALFAVCVGILVIGVYTLGSLFKGNLCLVVSLFIFSFHYFTAFSLIAQYTAIGVLCFAFYALFTGHPISGILLTIVAGTMHSSSFLFLPIIIVYVILEKIKKRWALTIGLCTVVVVGMANMKFLLPRLLKNSRFKGYLTDPLYADLKSASMVVIGIAVLLFMLIVLAQSDEALHDSKILLLFFIQFIETGLSLMQGDVILLFRLIYYFWFFEIFSIPLFTEYIKNQSIRSAIRHAVPFAYLAWEWVFPLRGNYYYILPYRIRP